MGECSFWYRPTRVVPDQRPLNGRCYLLQFFGDKKTENIIMKGTYLAVKLYEIFLLHLDIVEVRNVIGYIIDKQA